MELNGALKLLQGGNQLKRTARTGWVQRGVSDPETVAAHSFGVVWAVSVLALYIDEEIDLGKALLMAALHDLPEAVTSDIPSPTWRMMPPEVKPALDKMALTKVLDGNSRAAFMLDIYDEFELAESREAKLVRDADGIDLFVQAIAYELEQGNRKIDQFWQKERIFHYEISQAIFDKLRSEHNALMGRGQA